MRGSRQEMLKDLVRDISLSDIKSYSKSFNQLLETYEKIGGFSARYVYKGSRIIKEMLRDTECTKFLGFTANIVATGLRGLLSSIISRKLIDVIVTTGGSVDHDIARAFGGKYYLGEFEYDDIELKKVEIHRLGNILIPFESYGPVIESKVHELLDELLEQKDTWTPSELLKAFGERISDENSILFQAAKNDIPIFSPGIVDSAFGTALFTYNEASRGSSGKMLKLDVLGDMAKIADIIYSSKKTGAIVLGGGISKHHVIWWSQFKGGLDYAVYISTAVEWDGSLSGARTREAISWGKLKPSAKHVFIPADATIVFPIVIIGALIDEH